MRSWFPLWQTISAYLPNNVVTMINMQSTCFHMLLYINLRFNRHVKYHSVCLVSWNPNREDVEQLCFEVQQLNSKWIDQRLSPSGTMMCCCFFVFFSISNNGQLSCPLLSHVHLCKPEGCESLIVFLWSLFEAAEKVKTLNVQASAELSASNQATQLDVLVVDFQDLFRVTTLFEIRLRPNAFYDVRQLE